MFPYPPDPAIDMSDWADGPWKSEPSAEAWVDGRTGLNCAIVRAGFTGSLCGYVAVDPSHPLHGKGYRDRIELPPEFKDRQMVEGRDYGIIELLINAFDGIEDGKASLGIVLPAHGSITYSAEDFEGFWWFGFDCGHAFDFQPGLDAILRREGIRKKGFLRWALSDEMLGPNSPIRDIYRDRDYVYGIVTRLAWALEEMRVLASVQNQGTTDAG